MTPPRMIHRHKELGVVQEPRSSPVYFAAGHSRFLTSMHAGGQDILYSGWDPELYDYLLLTVPGNHPVTFRFSRNGVEKL